ncbi:allophanate hydrolase [soil metagenome]
MTGAAVARVRAAYRRMREVGETNVWISLREEEAVVQDAAEIDSRVRNGARLPLAGVLVGVKDNIDVLGLPTTAAAPSYSYAPRRDATAVARLRAAGAIVLGKTNLDQFATGLVGTRSPFGAVGNAWDHSRISGGSSAGSAVAVAQGIVDIALGTDTAGSGRVPAALNGIWGFKPTRGRVPTTGVVPACRSIDCVTVFSRDPALGRHCVDVMTGPDGEDPLARDWRPTGGDSMRRIAIPFDDELDGMADGWIAAFFAVVDTLEREGTVVVRRSIAPLLEAAALLYGGALVAERYAAVGKHIEEHAHLIGTELDPTVSAIILAGKEPSAAALFGDLERLDGYRSFAEELFDDVDALLTPTTTWHPTLAEVAADTIGSNSRMGRFTNFANLLDLSAVAVPAGAVRGLPFGVMLTGRAFDDNRLADVAGLVAGRWVDFAVFGAHLTDQPLNHELVRAGGSLISAVNTASEYRLYALDTTPAKPGLVHDRALGSSIAGELWRLPVAGFGTFVAGLPRPMVTGTVVLDDGSAVSGFLCEPGAIDGAEDITAHGGWRSWLGS